MEDDPAEYENAVAAVLHYAEYHARVAYDLAQKATLLSKTNTAIAESLAVMAQEGHARNAVLSAAYLAASGFGDDHGLHTFLYLPWLGREP